MPDLLTFGGDSRGVLLVSLAVSITYTLVKKHVPQLSGRTPAMTAAVVTLYSVLGRRR